MLAAGVNSTLMAGENLTVGSMVALIAGVLLVAFGVTMTAVSAAMPGAKPLYRPPVRFRVILISFGILMALMGAARLIRT